MLQPYRGGVGMTDDDAVRSVERVPLNLRIDKSVKKSYEGTIRQEYGVKSPYCGIELEREFRFRLDDSRSNEIWSNVTALADEFGQEGREKKISRPDRGETVIVRYNVAENVRDDIMQLAEREDFRSPGLFVESVMRDYATGRSIEERLVDRTDRILSAAKMRNEADDSTNRRVKTAASVLRNGNGFTVDEFFDVFDEHVQGMGGTDHAKKKHLPDVLDELNYTWHPNSEGLFVPRDLVDTKNRDKRQKPYFLMDDEDRRDAIRYALFEKDINSSGKQKTALSINELSAELGGSPQQGTKRTDMQTIAKDDEGFKYVDRSGDELLAIDRRHLEPDTREQLRAIARAEGLIQTDEPADEPAEGTSRSNEREDDVDEPVTDGPVTDDPTEQTTSWVDDVVSEVSHIPFDNFAEAEKVDELLTGKIALHNYAEPDEVTTEDDTITFTGRDGRLDELRAKVDDADLDEVRRELGLPETSAATEAEIEDEADEVFAALEGADRARADGGRPMK